MVALLDTKIGAVVGSLSNDYTRLGYLAEKWARQVPTAMKSRGTDRGLTTTEPPPRCSRPCAGRRLGRRREPARRYAAPEDVLFAAGDAPSALPASVCRRSV
jgi:hypothetical protein